MYQLYRFPHASFPANAPIRTEYNGLTAKVEESANHGNASTTDIEAATHKIMFCFMLHISQKLFSNLPESEDACLVRLRLLRDIRSHSLNPKMYHKFVSADCILYLILYIRIGIPLDQNALNTLTVSLYADAIFVTPHLFFHTTHKLFFFFPLFALSSAGFPPVPRCPPCSETKYTVLGI